MNTRLGLPLVLLLGACTLSDIDEDGYSAPADCDDYDIDVHPGATESCDGIDNNCDGEVDEGATTTFFADQDGDGFGGWNNPVEACAPSQGVLADSSDCDDADPNMRPGAIERCNGLDDDCDHRTYDGRGAYFEDRQGQRTILELSDAEGQHHDLAFDADGVLSFCPGTYDVSVSVDGAQVGLRSAFRNATPVLTGAGGAGPTLAVRDAQVTVEGLTLMGGAPASAEDGHAYGAVVYCEGTDASLTVGSTSITEGRAERGGGLAAIGGCEVDLLQAVVTNNTSEDMGGGIYLDGGTHRVASTLIEDNRTDGWGGGIHTSGGATVGLESVVVRNNSAALGGGGVHLVDTDLDWINVGSTSYVGLNRGGPGYDLYLDNSNFSADRVDFGPHVEVSSDPLLEIVIAGVPGGYAATGLSIFRCGGESCGVSETVAITVDDETPDSDTVSDRVTAANAFQVRDEATLDQLDLFIGSTGSCDATLYVLATPDVFSVSSAWTPVYSMPLDVDGPVAWRSTPRLGLPLRARWNYAIGVQASCAEGAIEWERGGVTDIPLSFGNFAGWLNGRSTEPDGYSVYDWDREGYLMQVHSTRL